MTDTKQPLTVAIPDPKAYAPVKMLQAKMDNGFAVNIGEIYLQEDADRLAACWTGCANLNPAAYQGCVAELEIDHRLFGLLLDRHSLSKVERDAVDKAAVAARAALEAAKGV